MPWVRPTLSELNRLALDDLSNAPGGDSMALLRRTVGRSLAWAEANQAHDLHGHLDWIARQSTPFTATDEYLEAWAALVGIYRKGAVGWSGTVTFPAAAGAVLPGGTLLVAGTYDYFTRLDAPAVAGVVIAQATAIVPGTTYDLVVGDQVTLTNGAAGITGAGAVAAVTQPGVDIEADDALRTRMLQRWAAAPQGGALADYLSWGGAVPGVTRVWAKGDGFGAGTVVVYVMFDAAEAANGGFPQGSDGVATLESRGGAKATGDQLLVADAVYPLRPVTAEVHVVSPIAAPQAFAIHPAAPVPVALQPAVLAAIDQTFLTYASPLGAELELDLFNLAIAAVPGMPPFTLAAPQGAIVTALGFLPMRGAVTYV